MTTHVTNSQNILLVSPAPLDGYPPVQNQARLLADEGYTVTILTSYLHQLKELSFSRPGIVVIAYALSGPNTFTRQFYKLCFLLKLLSLRLRLRPICEITYDPEGLFFSKICPFKTQLIIGHLHEVLIDPEARFYERFAIPFLRTLPLVVVADQDRAKLLAKQIDLPRLPVAVRNVPLFEIDSEYEIRDGLKPFSVIYHGAIGFTQALDSIIRSMNHWPPEVNFFLYGKPRAAIRQKLEAVAKEVGVADRVKFQGWVQYSRIAEKIASHCLGVSLLRPSHDNNLFASGASNKRYQYMQAGIPQISDDSPGTRDLIEGNSVGLCVSPESPEAIAQAVNYFYENPEVCAEYGARARKLVEEKFRYDLEFKPVIDFIKSYHHESVRL